MDHAWPWRWALAIALLALGTGCSSGALRQTRAHLERDDIDGAIAAAGDDRLSLEAVSLEILARGMSDPETRHLAQSGLRNAGHLARSALGRLADSEDVVISTLAAEVLAIEGDRRMRALLETRLDHDDGDVRSAALRGLGSRRDDAAFFLPYLRDTDARARSAAIEGLGRRSLEEAAAPLAEVARDDPSPQLRAAALRALSRIGSASMLLEAARTALGDQEILVRGAAIEILARLEDDESARALLVDRMTRGEPPEAIRAALILARRGDDEALARLRAALVEGTISMASAAALGAIGLGDDLRDDLLTALDRPEPEVRMRAAAALIQLGERDRSLAELTDLMRMPSRLGLQAAIALIPVDSEGIAARLARGLEDQNPAIRAEAASACARLEGGAEIARHALGDEVPTVRISAAAAVLRRLLQGHGG